MRANRCHFKIPRRAEVLFCAQILTVVVISDELAHDSKHVCWLRDHLSSIHEHFDFVLGSREDNRDATPFVGSSVGIALVPLRSPNFCYCYWRSVRRYAVCAWNMSRTVVAALLVFHGVSFVRPRRSTQSNRGPLFLPPDAFTYMRRQRKSYIFFRVPSVQL